MDDLNPVLGNIRRDKIDHVTAPSQAPAWYALYTRPRHEKWVVTQCESRSVESFLPLYAAKRVWKQRTATVHLPLFPAYVFVHITRRQFLDVVTIPSVVSLVSFKGVPATLPDDQIESLQRAVSEHRTQPVQYMTAGQLVRVCSGPLAGLEGIFLRREDSAYVVVSIEWMSRSVAIRLNSVDVESLCWQQETSSLTAGAN